MVSFRFLKGSSNLFAITSIGKSDEEADIDISADKYVSEFHFSAFRCNFHLVSL